MSRIELNVVATGNFRNLETSVARLRSQVEGLNASLMGVGFNANLSKSISAFENDFNRAIDSSGMFERHMVNLTSETTRFGRNLETGSLRLGQLFRAATEYRRGELGQIRQLAREQVRLMNASTMRMAGGGTQVIVPRGIDEGLEKQRLLNTEYRIFRQLVQNGSTEIINWGKNTQWAGRQLTVGLTVPLTLFGAAAGKAFMDADKQLTRLTKVYGDASKGMANPAELSRIRSETLALSQEIAKGLGVAVEETLGIAADIAATGKEGNELLDSTREAMRLSVLGEVDRQEAMRATLAIQSVFKKDTEGLTQSINLLNAVENQTSATINDLVTGIVKAGPVVQGLGGDVEDLAAMMVAMREGGITASEAANAIKSSLASLINPTKQTTQVLGDFGIDIKGIVDRNAGDVIGTLMDLQTELSRLDELSRQRSIEQIFGKFQFSRINALLANLGKAGSQTEQVFSLASMSVEELAANAERELTAVTESASGKFQRAIQSIKASLIPIGEVFLTVGTFIINVGNKILEVFNSLPDPVKNVVNGILGLTAVAGPIIMITGVLGNFFGYLVKGMSTIMAFKKEGRGAFELLTLESIAARDANELLSDTLYDQTTAMNTMSSAVDTLVKKLEDLILSMKGVGAASGGLNLDAVSREALAGAEASAAAQSPLSAAYGMPVGTYAPRAGKTTETVSQGVLYSHLTQNVRLQKSEAIPEQARSMVMGVGTVVDESLSELNRLLEVWQLDFSGLSDDTVTAMQRRQAIMASARKKFNAGSDIDIKKIEQIVQGMSTGELAQFAPTWQQISKQTANYFGTLQSMAALMRTNSAEMTSLFNQYRTELDLVGPEQALRNLQKRLSGMGIEVQEHINGVEKRIADIIQEVQLLPEDIRAGELEQRLIQLTGEVEGRALMDLQNLPGIGRSDVGYQRSMVLGAQGVAATEQQLIQASEETLAAQQRLEEALNEQIIIQENINEISRQREKIETDLTKARQDWVNENKKIRRDDQGNPLLGDKGRYIYESSGKQMSEKQQEDYLLRLEEKNQRRLALEKEELSIKQKEQEAQQRKLTSDELIALRRKELSDLKQDDQVRNSVSDRLYAAMKALAMLREKEKVAAEKQVAAQERLATAQQQAAEAQKRVSLAQAKVNQAWLTGGPNSPQYKAAQEELRVAIGLRADAETRVAASTKELEVSNEQLDTAKRNSARTERVYEQRLREDIIAVDLDTEATKLSTAAELRQAQSSNKNAIATDADTAATKKGGMFAGGKLGGAISMLSMAALFLPRPSEDTGAGQAANAGINIANMAAMGSIFGPKGILAGAAIGGIIEGIQFLGRRAEETAKELEKVAATSEALRTGLTDVERQFFNIKPLKQLTDLPLDAFNFRTEEATNKLKEFAQALKEAEPGSTEAGRVTAISEMQTAQQFIDSPMFSKMISEALLSGMSIEDVKVMVGGYLEAAGKQMFAPIVNTELTRIGGLGKTPEEIGAKYLAQLQDIADRVIKGAEYTERDATELRRLQNQYEVGRQGKAVQVIDPATGQPMNANAADMSLYLESIAKQYELSTKDLVTMILDQLTNPEDPTQPMNPAVEAAMRGITIDGKNPAESKQIIIDLLNPIKELVSYYPELNGIKDVMGAIGNETELMANAITSALGSGKETLDQFLTTLGANATAINNDKELIGEMSIRFGEMSEDAKRAFDIMIANGVELQDALRITSMVIADVNTDWAELADMAKANPAEFRAIVWTSFMQGSPVGSTPTAQGATAPEDTISAAVGAIDYSGGGGGGSSGSDYYDKLIEAQDKIIEGIQKEREERQKLLDIQEKQMDFALKRQGLENQIARAMAEGNLAEAALLQAQLDAEQKKYDNEEFERRRREREDRKIAAAEKEKERLGKLKEAASGGGGGASGGVSEQQKQWTANRINILTSGVVNWTEGAQLRRATFQKGPWSAFFESDQVKQYRQELEKLGVPAENIDAILNDLYDSWIDNNDQLFAQTDDYKFIEDSLKGIGIQGDQLKEIMPDVFGALLDKNLNPKQQIDVIATALYDLGYESDEAYRKAKKLYEQYDKDFSSKGIDDAIEKWITWNDIIGKAKQKLKQIEKITAEDTLYMPIHPLQTGRIENSLLQNLGVSQISGADRLEEISMTAHGQKTSEMGPVFNAGGVMLTGKQIGEDMMAGVTEGLTTGAQASEAAARWSVGILETWIRDETETESPSEVYKRVGKDMIAGLIDGLKLSPEVGKEIASSINSTFQNAINSYKILFADPVNGIDAVMTAETLSAANNFYTNMTTKMQETVDEINNILKTNLNDYTFRIIGDPKIYATAETMPIWNRVFSGLPSNIFTSQLPRYQEGGFIEGPGGPRDDKILARLSDGEYVIKASSVDKYGTGLLDAINTQKFANGGYISADRAEYAASRRPTYFGGTPTSSTGYNRPSPQYSGGTPTYSGGYTSSNSQSTSNQYRRIAKLAASSLMQPFSSPSLGQTMGNQFNDEIETLRMGSASLIDLIIGGFIPPWLHPNWGPGMPSQDLWPRTSIGSIIGGGDYINAENSQLIESILEFFPGAKGRTAATRLKNLPELTQDDTGISFSSSYMLPRLAPPNATEYRSSTPTTNTEYTRPILRPTAQQAWQAKRTGMFGLIDIPQVPYAFDPTSPESQQAQLPFSISTPPRFGVYPRSDRPRQTDAPTDYGKNSRVIQGYSDAWAMYVAMSTYGPIDPNNANPDIRTGPGMKSVSDIFPEYHTMGPARARGYNYGLIKIFGNLENAIRWGMKPMAIDPNPTLEEVPLDPSSPYYADALAEANRRNPNPNDPDANRRVSMLQYRDPTKDIDAEIYPDNWNEMSLEERALYKAGRALGYNQGLGYSTEKSLIHIPEFGQVPKIVEEMIRNEGTTPMGLAAKYASDKAPQFNYNKPVGVQNDFAIYQDESGRVWSSKEILAGRSTFSAPVYPNPPGVEELTGFQSSVQSAVDVATMATGVPDIITKSILRGVTGAIFDNPEGQGYINAFKQFAAGKMSISEAVILGTASTIKPNWSETEIMRPSNWAKWSSAPIGSPEWKGMYEYFTNQRDSMGSPIPNTTSRPGIPIGTSGAPFNTPAPPPGPPPPPGFINRAPIFEEFKNIPNRSFLVAGPMPGSTPEPTGPITGTGQAAMTPRLYSAYLRSLSQGRKGYVPPLVNPFAINPYALDFSKDALEQLPPGIDRREVEGILAGFYSPEQMGTLPGVELDPASRQTVLNMIRLSRTGISFLGEGEYEARAEKYRLHPRSVGYYQPNINNVGIKPITAGDDEYNIGQVYRTLFHELNHAIGANLGLTDSYKLYPVGNKNINFDESFKGIQADPNGPFNNQGMQFGIGIEEASATLAEHIMMRRKMGSKYSITDKDMDSLLYGNSDMVADLPFNILNGQLAYNTLYYLKNKDNKNSPFTEEEMKYLVDVAAQRFTNEMGERIDIPPGLTPLELAYMYAPTSLQDVMKKNGISGAGWKNGGLIKRFAEGGLARVGLDNLTLLGEGISNYAKQFVGTPYSSSSAWQDGPKNGWGCATATKWLYDSYAGVDVGHPSLSASQYSSGRGSKVSTRQPGDLLFFYYPNGVNTENPINHVGMYVGNGQMFHARSPQLGTAITGVDDTGMDRAVTRAGGTGIKRYLPMTIAGMGTPTARLAMGGKVYGQGGPTSDDILALVSNGEYVVSASAVKHYGKDFMDAVNKGILPEAATGGMLSSKYPGVVQGMASGGMLLNKYGKGGIVSSSGSIEYNINVNVAGTNASPDEIANKVMQTIRRSDKMKGGGIKV